MRENNTAVTMTPMTEYVVDGDRIYPRQAPPPRDKPPTVAEPKNRPKGSDKSKPRSDE